MKNALKIEQVSIKYGSTLAVDKANLEISEGEIVALLGPSGSGKSSLLRAVAGLEPLAEGKIWWRGQEISQVPPYRRGFGMMFQDGQLFPHQNVGGNIAYGLVKLPRSQRRERVAQMLELVGLAGFENRPIDTLSGGQAQRVALARSLAPRPGLLLLDEPLSALDKKLRQRLGADIRQVLKKTQTTGMLVTHDPQEAELIADRQVFMEAGKLRLSESVPLS